MPLALTAFAAVALSSCGKPAPATIRTAPKGFSVDREVTVTGRWQLTEGRYEDFGFRRLNAVELSCDPEEKSCDETIASVVPLDSKDYFLLRRYFYTVTVWDDRLIKAKGRSLTTDLAIEISLREKTATREERQALGDNPVSARFVLE